MNGPNNWSCVFS